MLRWFDFGVHNWDAVLIKLINLYRPTQMIVMVFLACLHSCRIFLNNSLYLAMSLYMFVLSFVPSFLIFNPSSIAVCVQASCCHILHYQCWGSALSLCYMYLYLPCSPGFVVHLIFCVIIWWRPCISSGPFLFKPGIYDKHFVFSCKFNQTIASLVTTSQPGVIYQHKM